MSLSDAKVRNAKPADKPYRLADRDGLHLFVAPTGLRSWRLRIKKQGHETLIVIGRYPKMGLSEARSACEAARQRGAGGQAASVPTFEEAARAWHALNAGRWKPHHAADVLASLMVETFPLLGKARVNEIAGAAVLEALRAMEQRGAVETARRVKQRCSAVFAFAISSGWCQIDPTSGLSAALAPLPAKGRRPAVTTLREARALIQAIDRSTGHPSTRVALRLLALTAARPGEVAGMRWDELHDFGGLSPEWRVPPERTKITIERARSAQPHIVPLTPAAIACIDAIRDISSRSAFLFPNAFSMLKPMSENAMGELLIRIGYQGRHVPHGWRATFSSVMNELYPGDRQVIDLMLAHVPKDRVEAAYNRAKHMARRRELAELWAGLLLDGAAPAEVLVTGRRRA